MRLGWIEKQAARREKPLPARPSTTAKEVLKIQLTQDYVCGPQPGI
jgi:hypothetical protein